MTNNRRNIKGPVRFPAEWEGHCSIMIAWPHADTDWAPMLDDITACYINLASEIAKREHLIIICPETKTPHRLLANLPFADEIQYVRIPTNDTWTRDYGPITIEEDGLAPGKDGIIPRRCLDFTFNGWGLKFASDYDNCVTRRMNKLKVLKQCIYTNRLDFVLEGGGIESNGKGLLMTTARCIFSPNRNAGLTDAEITDRIKRELGGQDLIVLNHGAISGDDTDSHIDTLARFTDCETIAYVGAPGDKDDSDYQELVAMEHELQQEADKRGLQLVRLPYAGPVYHDGERLPATYANFLIMPEDVLVPTYGLPTDAEALSILAECFPGREVVGVDCRALIRQHGSLHCATMQLYVAP